MVFKNDFDEVDAGEFCQDVFCFRTGYACEPAVLVNGDGGVDGKVVE